jgi:type VI secretion system lysozyme-like protein
MASKPSQYAAAVPLFERLTDLQPEQPREPRPLRTLSYPELMRSVRNEVARLLNTRGSRTSDQLLGQERSVLDYGATDLLWVNPYDPQSLHTFCRLMEETIEAFEPRLREPSVAISRFVQTESRIVLTVSAVLITQELREPVSFQVTASPRSKEPLADE